MHTPEQWARIKQIVGEAIERPPGERTAYLDSACGNDPTLRAEVESLLAAHGEADGLSENPWTATTLAGTDEAAKTLGPYRLIQELGVGGMGQVWLAEQTEPVRRRVALKLIRAGMYDAGLIKRFQAERQSLAMMDHPAIAKVFDAGATPGGQPYLVMEYVDGLPVTEYCDRKKLGIRDRLRLFIQVCEGVQHAHQKAIVHRDLKPSNILVTEVDGKPTPRIIDFGLAKATVSHTLGETLFTHAGGFVGTPGYMSPEQADPNTHDIDTRTDVYSLGVVLYELLTGYLPFDTTRWKQRRLDEVLRELRETDPPRPSTKISSNRDTSSAQAGARNTEPRQLAGVLRGDLDWITLKALEKEREQRYATPSALASDVTHYLENRPVEARPASTGYRLRKYLRRNRVAVAVAAGAASLLIAFAVMQTIELRRITRERDRADRITEFMTNMFKVSDPSESRGNTITAREILDKSSKEIDAGLARDPELKAQMLHVMGTVYEGMGLYDQAELLLKQAVDVRRKVLGAEHPDTLGSASRLAQTIAEKGQYLEAEKTSRDLLEIENRVLGPDHRTTLATESNLAWILQLAGRHEEAEKLCRQALERQQRVLGTDDLDTSESVRLLAVILEGQGRRAEAESSFRLNLEIRQRVLGPEHPRTLKSMSDLAIVLTEEDRYAEAEQEFNRTLEIQSRVLGRDHPETLATISNLATVLESQGRNAESEKLQREAFEGLRRVLGPDHPRTATALYNIGDVLYEEHRYPEAAKILRETVDLERRVLGAGHPDTLDSMVKLACVLAADHKSKAALAVLRDAFENGLSTSNDHLNLESNNDLKLLSKNPRFAVMVAEAQKRAAASVPKPN